MRLFMLDTDTCSYILKRSNVAVLRRLQTIPTENVCISAITKAELLYGVAISPRKQADGIAVEVFLRHIAVRDFSGDVAVHYAAIRADLKRRGTMIGAHDLFIAAHARALGATLVTNNMREFRRVRGLTVENWAAGGAA
ncbi:MAG TPA: type II toxin-antitoxin system VapC family toxin [Rhizomicrobium sp.]|jgi:tRNA(fMet)-specific endonuclease VapC